VHPDADGPSSILKVSGLDSNISEETLLKAFSAQAPVLDVRLVLDKYTGAPRGFGFVQFNDISDATRAMNALQGMSLPGGSRLRLCYARDRMVPAVRGSMSSVAQDALQAAAAMQQYSGWEPKEFGAVQEEETTTQAEEQPAAAGAGNDGTSVSPGFVYDSASGYWYDAASGYYYDANTSLYYHPSAQQWYSYNAATGEYTVAGGGSSGAAAAAKTTGTPSSVSGMSTAAQGAISATEAAVSAVSARSAAAASAAASQKKRGAVIGSAPQLNSLGLMAAVQQLQVSSQVCVCVCVCGSFEDMM
jgi:RNA-binding protein 5/10